MLDFEDVTPRKKDAEHKEEQTEEMKEIVSETAETAAAVPLAATEPYSFTWAGISSDASNRRTGTVPEPSKNRSFSICKVVSVTKTAEPFSAVSLPFLRIPTAVKPRAACPGADRSAVRVFPFRSKIAGVQTVMGSVIVKSVRSVTVLAEAADFRASAKVS